jgi:hypothetical protein
MAGKDLFANTAITTLAAALTDTVGTSVSVVSSALFPAAVTGVSQFRIRIDDELMVVTDVSGTTWTVERGAEGSTAATHLIAAPVYHIVTAGALNALERVQDAVADLTAAGSTTGTTQLVIATAPEITCTGVERLVILASWYNLVTTVATDTFFVQIYDGATAGSGTKLAQVLTLNNTANAGGGTTHAVVTPSAGAHTYTMRIQRNSGTGTAAMAAGVGAPQSVTAFQIN